MRCLVTGAAGFIGSHLAERLVAEGHHVVGLDCFTDFYARPTKEANLAALRSEPRFELLERDLATASLDLRGVDAVFHEAAQGGVRPSWGRSFAAYTQNNVLATQRLLEAAKEAGVRRVINASSSSVYGATDVLPMHEEARPVPRSPYGVTKLAAEHLAELYRANFGLSTVSLRYFTVYGPRQRPDMAFHRFVEAMLAGEPLPLFGSSEQSRDFTYVADVVEANVRALASEAVGVFNIGGGSRVSLGEAAALLAGLVGVPLQLDRQGAQAGDVAHTWADCGRASSLLGYRPRTGLRDGLAAQVRWQRQRWGGTAASV
ncbi:NAD-dependent epimerase/dehydratase family protein [Vulgatibacter sp.]|uniref:NAD-dependent epimerase/dehydratase family protein n=1 Tax=Vulgatibacter sp. TaxID=1971226 RepID=UPI003567EF6B